MTSERKVSIKTVTVLNDRLPQPSGVDGRVLTEVGGVIQWAQAPAGDKVKASATDTTPGNLLEKLLPGDNVTLTLENAGSDEHVRIAAASEPAQADLFLAVDPVLGSDTPSGDRPAKLYGGDYTAFPFATIQAAVNSLPNPWDNDCSIVLATGVHPGSVFINNLSGLGGIMLTSVEAEVEHSYSTGGGTRTLQDTTKSWTPDEHVGKFLLCPSFWSDWLPIVGNTADTITVTHDSIIAGTITPGWEYWIYEPSAFIDGPVQFYDSLSPNNGFLLNIVGVTAGNSINAAGACLTMDKVMLAGGGVNISRSPILNLTRTTLSGGALLAADVAALVLWHVTVHNSPQVGVWLETIGALLLLGVSVRDSVEHGVYLSDVGVEDLPWPSWVEAVDNGGNGLYLRRKTVWRLDGVGILEGAGNGAFGVEADSYCELIFKGAPTFPSLTGALGDLTIDRGATALGWIADFSTNGDAAVSPNLFCRVERKDT